MKKFIKLIGLAFAVSCVFTLTMLAIVFLIYYWTSNTGHKITEKEAKADAATQVVETKAVEAKPATKIDDTAVNKAAVEDPHAYKNSKGEFNMENIKEEARRLTTKFIQKNIDPYAICLEIVPAVEYPPNCWKAEAMTSLMKKAHIKIYYSPENNGTVSVDVPMP